MFESAHHGLSRHVLLLTDQKGHWHCMTVVFVMLWSTVSYFTFVSSVVCVWSQGGRSLHVVMKTLKYVRFWFWFVCGLLPTYAFRAKIVIGLSL